MITHHINGHLDRYTIETNGEKWIFSPKSSIISSDVALLENGTVNSWIVAQGLITGKIGIDSRGNGVTIDVDKSATIGGSFTGILGVGDDLTVNNSGLLTGNGAGANAIYVDGFGFTLDNSGTISGDRGYGVSVRQGGADITNEQGGRIVSSYAVSALGDAGEHNVIKNYGMIKGSESGVRGWYCDDKLINRGKITGEINLGDGDDIYDMRQGQFNSGHGYVLLSEGGDDVLITDDARLKLAEGADDGMDTVRSLVSYKLDSKYYVERLQLIGSKDIDGTGSIRGDRLSGNVGDNVLRGLDGDDTIDGGKGNDGLIGGVGSDTFRFRSGSGKDVIRDFDVSDVIDVSNWHGLKDFGDIKSHARNHGADLVITAGHDSITLAHTHIGDLLATDFIF